MIEITLALSGGVFIGAVMTGVCVLERPFFWLTCVRLPDVLHQQLKREARREHTIVRAVIIDRLRQSFEERP
jgi:hypothetical protein